LGLFAGYAGKLGAQLALIGAGEAGIEAGFRTAAPPGAEPNRLASSL